LKKDDVAKLQENLKSLLGDPTLRVDQIEDGSIVVNVEGSIGGFLKAFEIAKSAEFVELIGEVINNPSTDHASVLELTDLIYANTIQNLFDPRAAAAVVESVLVESGLLRPFSEISPNRVNS